MEINNISLNEIKTLNEIEIIDMCFKYKKNEQWPDSSVYDYIIHHVENYMFEDKRPKKPVHEYYYEIEKNN